ncbi:MAG TPA: hypothetical protein VGK89_13455 [Candidatus Eisenbacteria bacterium]
MSVESEPGREPAPSSIDSMLRRLSRLEASQRRTRAGLALVAVACLGGVVALLVWMERRHLAWRADTIFARRFVVEDSGRARAELGMDAHDWAVMRLGLDPHGVPGVAAGVSPGRGAQLFVQSGDGRKIILIGSTLALDAGSGVQAALEAGGDSGYLILNRAGATTRFGPTSHLTQVFPRGGGRTHP